jgi:hypothetical protein
MYTMRSSFKALPSQARPVRNRIAISRRPLYQSRNRNIYAMADNIGSKPTPEETTKDEVKKPELPKLTPSEFKVYNHMAEHMDYYVCTFATLKRGTTNLRNTA